MAEAHSRERAGRAEMALEDPKGLCFFLDLIWCGFLFLVGHCGRRG